MSSSTLTTSESKLPISKSSPESPTPIYLWFLQVLILWGAIAVVIWLSLPPKTPIYTITDVHSSWNYTSQVHNSSFTIRNMSSTSFIFNIKISNPNKRMGIYFDYVHLTLNHSGAIVGSKYLTGFYQGFKWSTTSCKVVVDISDQQFVMRGVAGAGGSSTTTDFRVGLEAAIQYEIFGLKTKHHLMDVAASVPIGSDGRLSDDEHNSTPRTHSTTHFET
ncbi:hypothetical protein FNV43_RR07758 [Rhamnella rubrinervis]|uniref:Late embryogenesis abundant protein LEA-2 subgroup domain-containing protein n=1 Tax=Rhamnella rubrinervis TaxID=2594499 RepID=A0A8K0HFI6_9ROSA|nr:hypothetical protein FNV43_RR07758 [Rhamnella rubrinervis]